MLTFLRLNNPTIIFFLSIIVLFGVRAFLFNTPVDFSVWHLNAAPLSYLLYKAAPNLLANSYFSYSISAILILAIAFSISSTINKYKIFGQRNYFVAWIFVLISCAHTNFLVLSPMLISSFLLFVLFKELFNLKEDKIDLRKVFNIGFLLSLSFLLNYSSTLILIVIFVAFFMFSKISLRVILVLFVGIAVPIIYFVFYFFWNDKLSTEFINSFSFFEINFIRILDFFKIENLTIFPIAGLAIAGLLTLLNKSQKMVREIRQFNSLLLLFSFIYFASLIFQHSNSMQSFVLLLFPFSIYITYQINTFKRILIAELTHLSLLLLVVFNLIIS